MCVQWNTCQVVIKWLVLVILYLTLTCLSNPRSHKSTVEYVWLYWKYLEDTNHTGFMKPSNYVVNLLLIHYGLKWDIYNIISRHNYIDTSVVSVPLITLISKIVNMLDIHRTTLYHNMGLLYNLDQRVSRWDTTKESHWLIMSLSLGGQRKPVQG